MPTIVVEVDEGLVADVINHSTKQDVETMLPHTAPSWFDPADAGERWDDEY